MSDNLLLVLYLAMLLLQTLHILEEISSEAYTLAGSLRKYLIVASVLVFACYVPLFLLLLNIQAGYYLGLFAALLAMGNGFVHVAGYIKTREYRGSLGAGVFTGIPLGIVGALVLWRLLTSIL